MSRLIALFSIGLLALAACDSSESGSEADAGERIDSAFSAPCRCCDGALVPSNGMSCDDVCPACDGGGEDLDAGAPGPSCALPAPFDEGAIYERTLYVDPGGDDSASGDASNPLASVNEAGRRATPGTRVVIRAGTYSQRIFLSGVEGEAERPIAFVAEEGAVLDIEGRAEVGLGLSNGRYVVIEGLTIRNTGVHGMNIDDGSDYSTPAHHIVLRGVRVEAAGSGGNNDCIKMSGVDDFWILDSDVSGCDRGELVDMVGCHRGVISGNTFTAPVGNGVQTKGGSADVVVHGNLFRDVPGRAVNAGGSTSLPYFRPIDAPHEAARISVVANVFVGGGDASGAPIAFVGCDECLFAHNLVLEPDDGWLLRILQESTDARFAPSRLGVVANNIFVLNIDALRTLFNIGSGTEPESFTFANNLWWALDRDAEWRPSLPAELSAEVDGRYQVDPRLDGYIPAADGPALAAGRALDGRAWPDRSGRCFAEPPSAGAYELVE